MPEPANEPASGAHRASPPRTGALRSPAVARLVLLGSLYFAQGLPYGFFTQAVPVLLRQQGASLSKIGFTALLTLPWALKFLWAPLVDRWYWPRLGRRKSWILPMQLASTLTLVVLAALPHGTEVSQLMVGVVLLNLFAATQDVATDGLAVEMLAPGERGLANGLQVAGYRAGMIIGGGVLLASYDTLGPRGVFAAMAALTALSSVPLLLTREPAPADAATGSATASATASAATLGTSGVPRVEKSRHFLALPGVGRILALLFLYKAGTSLATGMLRPFLTDAGLSMAELGWLLGTVGFVSGLLGALAGGALVTPLGRQRALVLFGVAQAVSVGGYLALALSDAGRLATYTACATEHFASGLGTAALFTAMMDWARPRHAATDYTVQASAVVIATGTASAVSGLLADSIGYPGTFGAATVLCLAATGAAWFLFPRRGFAAGRDDAAQ